MEYPTAQVCFGCVIEVLLILFRASLLRLGTCHSSVKWHLCWSECEYSPQSGFCELKLPLICLQSIVGFPFLSFKMTDTVSPSVSSRDKLLKSPFLQPPEPEVREAYFPVEVEMAAAAYLWCTLAEHFNLSVRCLVPWQLSPRQVCLLPLCSWGNRSFCSFFSGKLQLLFTPQRPAFLLPNTWGWLRCRVISSALKLGGFWGVCLVFII